MPEDDNATDTEFDRVLARAIERRAFLGGAASLGTVAFALGVGGIVPHARAATSTFDFTAIDTNTLDTVTVPKGYSWRTIVAWGDPLWSRGKPFDPETRGTPQTQAMAFGDNNDGMMLFSGRGRTLLCVNHEFVNKPAMFGNRESRLPETDADVIKGIEAVGVSVVEIKKAAKGWEIDVDAPMNRRVTGGTRMRLSGPAAGHALLKTAEDPAGETVIGTFANCGAGRTPWGTYLTCEENFDLYFSASDPFFEPDAAQKRYGLRAKDRGDGFARVAERFDLSKHPNEAHRFGYVVEIDPFEPKKPPVKRTALGRIKHENAALVVNGGTGHVVVYMGDDARGEFLYRYVSKGRYSDEERGGDLLDKGTLYAAKFNDDLTGEWLPLLPETVGMTEPDICVLTRIAASKAGATTMDRPEWVAVHPEKAEAYVALTNNRYRGKADNAGGDPMPVNGPNPREGNPYGQIVRWRPANGDHTARTFKWDLFTMAGNPEQHSDAYAGSKNIDAKNMFNGPDGLAFDVRGRLWIQTDGNYSNEKGFAGMGNNQMLVADPVTAEIRRFMVGPKECEITGLCWDADATTMFVGIQHPGERGGSHFPGGGASLPRSCVIAVTRDDGAPVG
ncbi:MAG: PhoX family phosphatase [Rhodospirillales bacterium]|nr:PhoX family phosphatase [Rhodospirillales bacterium]MBO6785286.1 PhoX family phosphatase [Rhodospirillales bacterium]